MAAISHVSFIIIKEVIFNNNLTRLPSEQLLVLWLRTRKTLANRECICTNLIVSCPYKIIVYSGLEQLNTTRIKCLSALSHIDKTQ